MSLETTELNDSASRLVLVIGMGSFIEERLLQLLGAGGFEVSRDLDLSCTYAVALLALPAGREVALLESAGVDLIGVGTELDQRFVKMVHAGMSDEAILHSINDWLYRTRGTRRHRRIPACLPIVVTGSKRTLHTTTSNVSLGGVFVRCLNPFPQGARVNLRLERTESMELAGQVVYTIGQHGHHIVRHDDPSRRIIGHPGMAIRFLDGQQEAALDWLKLARTHEEQP